MMNFALWIIAGGVVGWAAFKFLDWNMGRSLMISIVIGTCGGLFGGKVLAPLFSTPPLVPNSDFAMVPLVVAMATAAILLFAGDQSLKRWDI